MNNELIIKGQKAKDSCLELINLSTDKKNSLLLAIKETLINNIDDIINANKKDIDTGNSNGLPANIIDRLMLDSKRITDIATSIDQIILLEDPNGKIISSYTHPKGMIINKVKVPLGVIGMIYEARPNVTVDAAVLNLKVGNVTILRGSKDAINTNIKLVELMRKALIDNNVNPDCIQLIEETSRETARQFMQLNKYLDCLIPRGSANLIKTTLENATVPVIETGSGNCHVFVNYDADYSMSKDIILNAKTQRTSVCNSCESILLHKDLNENIKLKLINDLLDANVTIYADESLCKLNDKLLLASEEDYYTEYLSMKISIKTIDSLDDAINHINEHSTHHSETIITSNKDDASKFCKSIDSACVYHNVSTRFSDGFEFGLGAEIGISTQKTHARGPMGLEEMCSYKFIIEGNGQIR